MKPFTKVSRRIRASELLSLLTQSPRQHIRSLSPVASPDDERKIMCYFYQTRWTCGYWRWGQFKQQCNKEYRTGETCGLKLVYTTVQEADRCKLCHDIDKKNRRILKMTTDIDSGGPKSGHGTPTSSEGAMPGFGGVIWTPPPESPGVASTHHTRHQPAWMTYPRGEISGSRHNHVVVHHSLSYS
ncbi:hypothetical protein HYQ45_017662 [Verticillium longisporum]|uniref:Uncharacterized protein n=1 Tax=Verticillium longisporum TaxID=100787 RepID=A0A8I2Z3L1_VERLO|nr:hypothetical protein HYQ45_017662 [Verticillium longisporum]